jgi:hypothetical protein
MSFPFRFKTRPDTFADLVEYLRAVVERFPDARTGSETVYTMADAALGAFSVFFTQSPSFRHYVASAHARRRRPRENLNPTRVDRGRSHGGVGCVERIDG